jgi:hypothetical protein
VQRRGVSLVHGGRIRHEETGRLSTFAQRGFMDVIEALAFGAAILALGILIMLAFPKKRRFQ